MEKQKLITQSIDEIRGKLEGISEKELTIKQAYHRVASDYRSIQEDLTELSEFKNVKE